MGTLRRTSRFSLEKEMKPRTLFSHLQKAINGQETPPKSKHVRAIILETFTQKSSFFLYSVVPELQVPVNEIACWKFLVVLHKVLRNGHEEAVRYDSRKINVLTGLRQTWEMLPGRYCLIICDLIKVILRKLAFHRRFSVIPGDLQININSLLDFVGRTPDNQFTLCICLMDYLEILLSFQETVFANVSKLNTTALDARQCQLVSLVQCIQDCAALYDLTLKTLIQLHTVVSFESLAGHRQRFNAEYYQLRDFFRTANRSSYFRDLLKIPLLPDNPPKVYGGIGIDGVQTLTVTENSDEQSDLRSMPSPEPQLIEIDDKPAVFVENQLTANASEPFTDVAQRQTNPFLTTDPVPLSLPSTAQHEYMLEIEMLKSEIERVQNEESNKQQQLLARIKILEDEIKGLVQVKSAQDDEVANLSADLKEKAGAAAAADEKYKKIRDVYAKLREEHVDTLRKLGALQTQCSELQKAPGPAVDSQIADLQNQLTALRVEQVSSVESRRVMEADLQEKNLALQAAEDRISRLQVQLQEAGRAAVMEIRDRLLKAACARALEDIRCVPTLLELPEFLQCRSCPEVASNYTSKAVTEIGALVKAIADCEVSPEASEPLALIVAQLVSYLCGGVINSKAIANSASSIETSDALSALCKSCIDDGSGLFTNLAGDFGEWRLNVVRTHAEALKTSLTQMERLISECQPQIKDVSEEDLASMLEKELQSTMELVAKAEQRFRELLEQSKTLMTGIQLEVHSKILDSCTGLMAAIAALVAKARELQNEIVSEGRGAASATEFYKRHHRWTEGLFSAAKSVGAAANMLVEFADAIVNGKDGKLEQLLVAALEISSCTTQLLVASRVKARSDSVRLAGLEDAAKEVSKMTGKVVAEANNGVSIREQSADLEFTQLGITQARRAEMDSQVRVLELEASLAAERKKLGELRRYNYSNSAEVEKSEESNSPSNEERDLSTEDLNLSWNEDRIIYL
nr:unnamed protein product [Spirometra erinaceieuropaei]